MAGLKVKGTDSAVRKYSGAGRYASGTTIGITDFVVSFCRYCWGMGIGVAMSAILFLPTISALRQGKGQYENIEFSMEFTGDLLSAVRGYVIGTMSSYGYAALFCGGIAVFGSIALLFSGSCRIRQKIAYIILLGVCFLMLQWKPAMLVFSLMKRADSYWYRYSYLIAFVLLFGAGAYLSRAEEDRWSKVFVVLLSLAYAAGVLKLNGIHAGDITSQFSTLLKDHTALVATAGASLVLAILTLLLIAVKPKEGKGIVSLRGLVRLAAGILLLAVTAAELGANAWMFWKSHLDDSQELYMEYSKGMQSQLSQLNAVDDGYYRIAQDRTRWHQEDDLTAYFNDSLAQNYWSNAAYTSSPDNAQIDLMWKLGYRDEAGCMLIVRDPVVASDSFLGVKYYLQSTPIQGLEPVEGVEAFNGRAVYPVHAAFLDQGKQREYGLFQCLRTCRKIPCIRQPSLDQYRQNVGTDVCQRQGVLWILPVAVSCSIPDQEPSGAGEVNCISKSAGSRESKSRSRSGDRESCRCSRRRLRGFGGGSRRAGFE